VVERLLAEGGAVRALVRDEGAAAWLARLGAELRVGDVLDAESVRRAAAGCAVIHHAAAWVGARGGGGWEAYRRPNVDGTRSIVRAAEDTGARVVHVSSIAVYGAAARDACPEDAPLAPLPAHAHYARSKREAEAVLFEAHAAGRVWATAIRPSVIYGRRDRHFVPRVARLLRLGAVPLPGGGRTPFAVVHAAAVADAAVRAAVTDAAAGRPYNVAHDFDVTVRDFFRLAASGLGRRVRLAPVPLPLVHAGVWVVRRAGALLPGADRELLPRSTVDFLTRGNPYVSGRARRELGWAPAITPDVGVPDAFRWLGEGGRELAS
jgi:nucleoside-diphosphate-sugar epimerase